MSTTERGGGTQHFERSGDPWLNATNYQRQQLLGVGTGLLGGGGYDPGYARWLTGTTGAGTGSKQAQTVERAFGRLLAPNPLEVPGDQERAYLGRLQGFAGRPTVDPLEAAGLYTQAGTANPSQNLAAAREYLQRISGPAITNSFTAAGMGRGGGVAEALGNEGTRMTLPILQDSLNAQRQLAGMETDIGGQRRDRELSDLQTALAAAEGPRLAELQSTTKPEQLLLQAYGLAPVGTGAGSDVARISQWSRPSEFSTVMKAVQGIASIAGAFMMCWVANAAWGPQDPRFWHAWAYVNFDPSVRAGVTRVVYRAVGRHVAHWGMKKTWRRRFLGWLLERVIPGV